MGSGAVLLLLLPLVAAGIDADVEILDAVAGNATDSEEVEPPAASATTTIARKCCPPGLSMYRVNAPGCDNEVTCKITDGSPSILWSLQPGGGGQYGFPTTCPRELCRLVLLENATATPAHPPYCVDKLVETDPSGQIKGFVMAGMACKRGAVLGEGTANRGVVGEFGRLQAPTAPASPSVPVVPFRKCCAVHQAYDLVTRLCLDARGLLGGDGAPLPDDSGDSTPPPPADYESQRRAVSALLNRVLDKNLTALVDMAVGFPNCEQSTESEEVLDEAQSEEARGEFEHTALLDVAVFDLPWDERLMDELGVVALRPESLTESLTETDGDAQSPAMLLRPGDYCVDDAGAGTLVVKACLDQKAARKEQVCRRYGCFRKCCPHDKYFAPVGNTHGCVPRPAAPLGPPLRPKVHDPPAHNLSDVDAYVERTAQDLVDDAYRRFVQHQRPQQVTFSSIVRNICPEFRFRLDEEDAWFFDRLGTLYQPGWPDTPTGQYCTDDSAELSNLSAVLICLAQTDPTQTDENTRIMLITVGLLISCMFLALTLGTYCCLPALQNLHGKTLMCHVSSLLVAYLFLALTQMLTRTVFLDNEWICSIIGNCVLFTFLSAFSWLNVMCYDIWRTFGGMTSTRTVKRSIASRRFRWYCAYALGVSSAITAVCVVVDQWPGNDKSVFRPQIGDGSCWFRTEPLEEGQRAYGILIFFAGPLLVQTCSNVVLFVLTVLNYSRIKGEINRLHDPSNSRKVRKFQADSNKLKMNLKLFVVMGVTWVLELVSTFFPREHAVFYLSDAANALQGVMIFAIFVLKRKVIRALAARLGCAPPLPVYSTNPSIQADCRLSTGLAVRGKTTSTNTLFSSEYRNSTIAPH